MQFCKIVIALIEWMGANLARAMLLLGVLVLCIAFAFVFLWEEYFYYICFGVIGLIGFTLAWHVFVVQPRLGVGLLILEAILGGNGRWFVFSNTDITPRYALLPLVLAGYLIRRIKDRKAVFPKIIFGPQLFIFGILTISAVIHAIINGNQYPFQEAQVWLYLLIYPIIIDLWENEVIPVQPIRILIWGTVIMALFQISLFLLVNYDPSIFVNLYLHTPIERMRILISPLAGTGLFYVFWGNIAICGVVMATAMLIFGSNRFKMKIISRAAAWKIIILMFLAMALSMGRAIWAQMALTIMMVGFICFSHRRISLRLFGMSFIVILISIGILLFSPPVRKVLKERLGFLFVERSYLDAENMNEYSIVNKKNENDQLCVAISANPLFGYGFGLGLYQKYGNELIKDGRFRFHNYFLGFTLKTGIIGLFGLLQLLLSGCIRSIWVGYILRHNYPELQVFLFGLGFGFMGILLSSISNPHLGVPAIIIVFALMLAIADLGYNKWRNEILVI